MGFVSTTIFTDGVGYSVGCAAVGYNVGVAAVGYLVGARSSTVVVGVDTDTGEVGIETETSVGVDITDVVGVLTGVETTDDVGLDTTDDVGTDIIPTPFVLSIDSFKNGEEKLIFLIQSFFVPIAMYIALTIAINIIENILL